jgi:hypothetical protein
MRQPSPCPPFVDAVRRFEEFLEGQGWPPTIRWVAEEDLERSPGRPIAVALVEGEDREAEARGRYEIGQERRLGVLLHAICTLGGASCAVVSFPEDERESERLMFPSDGSLKLSVAVPREEGEATARR